MSTNSLCSERTLGSGSRSLHESNTIYDKCIINKMPPEMLTHVISFLSFKQRIHTQRTCKLWQNINRGSNWQSKEQLALTLVDYKHSGIFSVFKNYGNRLLRLYIKGDVNHSFEPTWITNIITCCPNLQELILLVKEISKETIICVANTCTRLRIIYIEALNEKNPLLIQDSTIEHLLKSCPLQELRLSKLIGFTGRALGHASMLHSLDIGLTDAKSVGKNCFNLEELIIDYCPNLKTSKLAKTLKCASKTLKVFVLECGPELNHEMIDAIATCRSLRELVLNDLNLCDAYIEEISKFCKELRLLRIGSRGIISDMCFYFISRFPELHDLYFASSDCTNLSDEGLKCLAENQSLIKVFIGNAETFTADSIVHLLRNCKSLKELYVHTILPDSISDDAKNLNFRSFRTERLKMSVQAFTKL